MIALTPCLRRTGTSAFAVATSSVNSSPATPDLPALVAKLVRQKATFGGGTDGEWVLRPGENVIPNPFGEVPFFELRNRLTGATRSEVER